MSRTKPAPVLAVVALLLAGAIFLTGCDSTTSINIGTIRVTVISFGNNLDANGYIIRVTGNGEDQSQQVDVNGQVLFAVEEGRYQVELTDKADNCVVNLNPQAAQVSGGITTDIEFETLCG